MKKVSMIFALGALTACSNTSAQQDKAPVEEKKAAARAVGSKACAQSCCRPWRGADAVKVVIEGNDAMQFNLKEVKVPAGSTVALTLNHTGKIAKAAMGHNIVILAAGTDVNKFSQRLR